MFDLFYDLVCYIFVSTFSPFLFLLSHFVSCIDLFGLHESHELFELLSDALISYENVLSMDWM